MNNPPVEKDQADQEKPPVFSTWNRWYAAVLLNLALLIILFFLFMKVFD